MKALLVVDLQNDFLPGGALAVGEGDTIIPHINSIQQRFDLIVATQDWHPHNHKSFASQHEGYREFDMLQLHGLNQVLWPDHCVQGTFGADFSKTWDSRMVSAIFRKGMDREVDSYSGFYDNNKRNTTGLLGFLKEMKVTEVYVCGLAADFCVFYTAMDAAEAGFSTFYLEFATKAIDAKGYALAKKSMEEKGIVLVESAEKLVELENI